MIISSRTPEGDRNRCLVCGHKCKIVPACTTSRDAPCPRCGHLLWFVEQEAKVAQPPEAQLPTTQPFEWPSFVTTVANLPSEFFVEFRVTPEPDVRLPQRSPPVREPAAQAARLIARLLRRGQEKFGKPWPWQRWQLEKIDDPYAAERLLSLLHDARSWRGLLAAWNNERVYSSG